MVTFFSYQRALPTEPRRIRLVSYAAPNKWFTPHPTSELGRTQQVSYAAPNGWATPHPTIELRCAKQVTRPRPASDLRRIQQLSYAAPNKWATPHPTIELRCPQQVSYAAQKSKKFSIVKLYNCNLKSCSLIYRASSRLDFICLRWRTARYKTIQNQAMLILYKPHIIWHSSPSLCVKGPSGQIGSAWEWYY